METRLSNIPFDLEELIARPSKRDLIKLKRRFLFFSLMTNIFIFIWMRATNLEQPNKMPIVQEKGSTLIYAPMQIMLELKRDQKTKVSILNEEGQIIIREAFIWPPTQVSSIDSDESNETKYQIELSESDAFIFMQYFKKNSTQQKLSAVPKITYQIKKISKVNKYEEFIF